MWKCETRDGSGNVELQVYHGTRYIDEVVGLRVKDLGRLYASQGERSERLSVADRTGRKSEQGCERQTLRPARRTRTESFAPGGANWNVTLVSSREVSR